MDLEKHTALHLAAERNRGPSVELLLAHGADSSILDTRGYAPHHVAAAQVVHPGSTTLKIIKILTFTFPFHLCTYVETKNATVTIQRAQGYLSPRLGSLRPCTLTLTLTTTVNASGHALITNH